MKRAVVVAVAGILFGAAVLIDRNAATSLAFQATPESSSLVAISNEVLGSTSPVDVENPELSLSRVTIMPGAGTPVHYHPGTEIGLLVQGELTYTVFTGEITWYSAERDDPEPYDIKPGETVVVRPGGVLIESPLSIHQGRNEGAVPVVIYLSALFPEDSPRSIIAEATPVP